MPYKMPNDIPEYIKGLPEGAQSAFVEVFNRTLDETKDEEKARIAGWGAVKQSYEKTDKGWVKKMNEIRYVSQLFALAEGSKVSRVQVMRTGTFHHPMYGKFSIKEGDLDSMVKNFAEHRPKAPTELVVDYEHQSTTPMQKAKAAGWIKGLERVKEALFMLVEWTGEAAKAITANEYRFISPEFNLHYTDKETGKDIGPTLLSAALTNRPFLEGMGPVMLSETLDKALNDSIVYTLGGEGSGNFGHGGRPGEVGGSSSGGGGGTTTPGGHSISTGGKVKIGGKPAVVRSRYQGSIKVSHEGSDQIISYDILEDKGNTLMVSQPGSNKVEEIHLDKESQPPDRKSVWDGMSRKQQIKAESDDRQNMAKVAKYNKQQTLRGAPVSQARHMPSLVELYKSMILAEWSTEYIDNLPDSSFAYISAGGEKDESGKTAPRSLRHLPYKDAEGEVDREHLANAMARLDQVDISPAAKEEAKKALMKAEESVGMDTENEEENTMQMTEAEITALKEKAGKADGFAVQLTELIGKHTALETEAAALRKTILATEATGAIEKAIAGKKLLPAQKEWATNLYLSDKASFTKFVETAPAVGPDLGEKGKGGGTVPGDIQLSETEIKLAEQMNGHALTDVERVALIKAKQVV